MNSATWTMLLRLRTSMCTVACEMMWKGGREEKKNQQNIITSETGMNPRWLKTSENRSIGWFLYPCRNERARYREKNWAQKIFSQTSPSEMLKALVRPRERERRVKRSAHAWRIIHFSIEGEWVKRIGGWGNQSFCFCFISGEETK